MSSIYPFILILSKLFLSVLYYSALFALVFFFPLYCFPSFHLFTFFPPSPRYPVDTEFLLVLISRILFPLFQILLGLVISLAVPATWGSWSTWSTWSGNCGGAQTRVKTHVCSTTCGPNVCPTGASSATDTKTCMYIYISIYVCVCVCVFVRKCG